MAGNFAVNLSAVYLVRSTHGSGGLDWSSGKGRLWWSQAEESAAHRPKVLDELPGGGIRDGAIVDISDQAQAFEAQLIVTHQVLPRLTPPWSRHSTPL